MTNNNENNYKNNPNYFPKRNEFGLLEFEGLEYKYDAFRRVDWARMIPAEFLYINPEKKAEVEKKYGKKVEELNITELEDKYLAILLGGIKYLLDLRGYLNVSYNVVSAREGFAAVQCSIQFTANYETEGVQRLFTENASVSPDNASPFALRYALEIATNRAFCRCVRNFLKINIVSKEELAEKASQWQQPDAQESNTKNTNDISSKPREILTKLMIEKNLDINRIKQRLQKEGYKNWELINVVEDISTDKIIDLVEKIKKMKS